MSEIRIAVLSICFNIEVILTYWCGARSSTNHLQGHGGRWLLALVVRVGMAGSFIWPQTIFAVYINDIVSQFPFSVHRFIVFYADDILLMASP